MKKKIISLLTTLVMVVGLVGVMPSMTAGASGGVQTKVNEFTSRYANGSWYQEDGCYKLVQAATTYIFGTACTRASSNYYAVKTVSSFSDMLNNVRVGDVIDRTDGKHAALVSSKSGSSFGLFQSAHGGYIDKTDFTRTVYNDYWNFDSYSWTIRRAKNYDSIDGGSTPTPTPTPGPTISFSVTDISNETAYIRCDLSGVSGWSSATLYFGRSADSLNFVETKSFKTFIRWRYENSLNPGTTYYYKIDVSAANGQSYSSGVRSFTTTGHTHSYTSKVIAPTCTSQGYTLHTCSCGNSYKDNYKNAISHSYIDAEIKPTSTKDKGYTIHTCRNCGYFYKDNYVELKNDGYYYASKVPSWANNNNYTVEYKSHSEKIATSSPGSGWVNAGVYKTEYQNVGSPYENYHYELPTSNERVLVGTMYYHFCGPNAGTKVNYDLSGNYVHWDSVDGSRVSVSSQGTDSSGGMPYYILNWNNGSGRVYCKSGVTCDGVYGSHGNRAYAWYKIYTYQNRTKVTYYKFVKDTGWTTSKDNSANSVEIRFKRKQCTHSYKSSIIAPTCTSQGYTLYRCTKCGNSYKSNYTNKTSHIYGKWITVTSPTCTKSGVKARSCTGCGIGQTSTISALGHNYKKTTTKPTTTSVGYTVHKCTRCNSKYTDTYEFTKMSGFKTSSVSSSAVKLTWNKVSGAQGYIVYKYDNSKKTWVRAAKTKTTANTYTVLKLASGTSYKFAVKPYKTVSGKEITSSSFPTVTAITKLPTVVNGTTIVGKNSVKLTWKKTTGAQGYIVYKYDNSKKTWVRVAKTKSLSYLVKKLKSGTNYKFAVKAYKYVNKKEITSVSFKTISVKTKK